MVGLAVALVGVAAGGGGQPVGAWDDASVERAAVAAGATADERAGALALHARRRGPLWHGATGVLTPAGGAVVAAVGGLEAHGLARHVYHPPRSPVPADVATADVALTVAALRAMRHLHLGRVDPRTLGFALPAWAEPHDFAARLEAGLAAGTPAETIAGMAPPLALYRRLTAALARYRQLEAAGAWPPLPPAAATVRPGDAWPTAALRARLVALGDLEASATADPDGRYDGEVVEGVRRFQRRHGLTDDGAIGVRTRVALDVTPSARAWQIVLALERLRWLPDLGSRRLVAVNVPMFRLWAWEAPAADDRPALTTAVIVGRAGPTPTPIFADVMEQVVFRPYWNVPRSILAQEVLPAWRRSPGYLDAQHMEIVAGAGDAARVVAADPAAQAGLEAGTLRVRQRPGPHNALGLVKFDFPNDASVYLHGTPTPQLFARDRRDFSHGCIRVADPPALAAWVLGRQREPWTSERIAAAMAGPDNAAVPLDAPIDVVIFYLTAVVMPEDGRVHFAEDLYGHDAALTRALDASR
ncbi:MAG: murein L,D-transpeptidase [Vicinamibacterales bacterium]